MSETTETRPRRTLADVVANPPEGWVWDEDDQSFVYGLDWITGEYDVALVADKDEDRVWWTLTVQDTVSSQCDILALAKELRLAADLLDLLAEVSDV